MPAKALENLANARVDHQVKPREDTVRQRVEAGASQDGLLDVLPRVRCVGHRLHDVSRAVGVTNERDLLAGAVLLEDVLNRGRDVVLGDIVVVEIPEWDLVEIGAETIAMLLGHLSAANIHHPNVVPFLSELCGPGWSRRVLAVIGVGVSVVPEPVDEEQGALRWFERKIFIAALDVVKSEDVPVFSRHCLCVYKGASTRESPRFSEVLGLHAGDGARWSRAFFSAWCSHGAVWASDKCGDE